MLHSGSRGFGYKIAKHYNKVAQSMNQKWYSSVPKEQELAFLPMDSEEGIMYMNAMKYAVDFALANRRRMLKRTEEILHNIGGFIIDSPVNIAHNYAQYENHFGKNVVVHRKGATSAREGELGIIPGSQGTCSYIIRGLGNRDSFTSCSHGAGRVLARKQACRTLDLVAEQKRLDDLGVIHGIRTVDDLDEAPGAYKDIDVVMENQKDLVEIVQKLTPMAVIKG